MTRPTMRIALLIPVLLLAGSFLPRLATASAAPVQVSAPASDIVEAPAAQAPPAADGREAQPRPEPDDAAPRTERPDTARRQGGVRVGHDYRLPSGQEDDEVVLVAGDAFIDGHVRGDVVVMLGTARLGPAAVVDGSLVVIGGEAQVSATTVVRQDVVVVGGPADLPAGFEPGGQATLIGTRAMLDRVRDGLAWVWRGLAFGRLIVPDLGWVWVVVGLVFIVHLLTAVILHGAVGATAATVASRPLGSLLTGLAALVLSLPAMVVLAITVVGLPAIPLGLVAMFAAGLVGRVAVARAIGEPLIRPDDRTSRTTALGAFLIGSVLLVLLYMVPVAGLLGWLTVGTMGLGAALLTVAGAWRGESPRAVPPPVPPPPPPFPTSPSPMSPPDLAGAPPVVMSSATAAEMPGIAMPGAGTASTASVSPPSMWLHYPRASFGERALALLLDLMLVGVLAGTLSRVVPVLDDAYLLILLATLMTFWVWKGTSMGGMIVGLRVVRSDGSPVQAADAIVRGLVGVLSFAAFGLGVLWILRDPQRQAWHDKAVGTVVVKVPRPS